VLLLPGRDTSIITKESVTGFDPDEPTELERWEEVFLPTVASAFSCGFTNEDKHEDPSVLPNDMLEEFPKSLTVQQVW